MKFLKATISCTINYSTEKVYDRTNFDFEILVERLADGPRAQKVVFRMYYFVGISNHSVQTFNAVFTKLTPNLYFGSTNG